MTASDKKRFKNWFDTEAAQRLAAQISLADSGFDQARFISLATQDLTSLEMSARVAQFSEALSETLPGDKQKALEILTRSLPTLSSGNKPLTDGWLQWPLGKFIADYGLPHFEMAMTAMIELTQRFTSEFAVRPCMEHRQTETLARLLALTQHPNPHVRRWCSEGTRPLLPWGKKLTALTKDPTPVWPILEALKDDPERYVQKSVANHLNDIAKNHPNLVVARCEKWMKNVGPERKWIIRHGLRTLIKDGHPGALALLGYTPAKNLQAELILNPETVCIGQSLTLHLDLKNQQPQSQRLLIDFAIHYVRQNNKIGRKVFKWTTLDLAPNTYVTLQKTHAMKRTSVRALYPGIHKVEILVNGISLTEDFFELTS